MAVRILAGDCRLRLAELPAGSVHCCVTSPPYYGLRSYQCEPQVWGGKPDCEHEVTVSERGLNNRHAIALLRGDEGTEKGGTANHRDFRLFDATCIHCGAWVGELGLEPTVELYLAHLLEVFAAVRRTMRDDATLWVNLGSSYGPGGQELQVPARFALAMQGAGWLLRSAIVLAKAAPMPESVTGTQWVRCRVKVKAKELTGTRKAVHAPQHSNNVPLPGADAEYSPCPGCSKCEGNGGMVLRWGMGRPTSAYEYLFLFSKGARYFYNSEAVRVPQSAATLERFGNGGAPRKIGGPKFVNADLSEVRITSTGADGILPAGANARNVLAWKPAPLAEAHYAAFPPFIPAFAIRAGTAEQVCGECGAPYAPVVERETTPKDRQSGRGWLASTEGIVLGRASEPNNGLSRTDYQRPNVLAHRPTCRHHAPPAPATVLDCFAGSGTTLMVAERLGRDAVGVDLQPDYVAIAERRAMADAGLFAEVDVCEGVAESNGRAQLAWEF